MCLTPGSDPARSSSTPSNAPRPSRLACGSHISVQPAGAALSPHEAGGGGAGAGCEAPADGDGDTVADGAAEPGTAEPDPAGPAADGTAQLPAAGERAGPPNPPSSATIETTALAARQTASAGTPTRASAVRDSRGTVRYPITIRGVRQPGHPTISDQPAGPGAGPGAGPQGTRVSARPFVHRHKGLLGSLAIS